MIAERTPGPHLLDWRRVVVRASARRAGYGLTGWRTRHEADDGGRLGLLKTGPCSARLRWTGPGGDGLVEVSRRRAWLLGVVACCGGRRATLREVRRIAAG